MRLVGRVDLNGFATGALQLAHDGAFGAVCAKEFDAADAAVACRQLGFSGGIPVRPLPLGLSADDISDLQRVRCAAPRCALRCAVLHCALRCADPCDNCSGWQPGHLQAPTGAFGH